MQFAMDWSGTKQSIIWDLICWSLILNLFLSTAGVEEVKITDRASSKVVVIGKADSEQVLKKAKKVDKKAKLKEEEKEEEEEEEESSTTCSTSGHNCFAPVYAPIRFVPVAPMEQSGPYRHSQSYGPSSSSYYPPAPEYYPHCPPWYPYVPWYPYWLIDTRSWGFWRMHSSVQIDLPLSQQVVVPKICKLVFPVIIIIFVAKIHRLFGGNYLEKNNSHIFSLFLKKKNWSKRNFKIS